MLEMVVLEQVIIYIAYTPLIQCATSNQDIFVQLKLRKTIFGSDYKMVIYQYTPQVFTLQKIGLQPNTLSTFRMIGKHKVNFFIVEVIALDKKTSGREGFLEAAIDSECKQACMLKARDCIRFKSVCCL